MQVSTYGQLSASAHNLGGALQFDRDLPGDLPVLVGTQSVLALDSGLVLYLSKSADLVDARSQNLLQPGIMAAFLLEGQADVSLGHERVYCDAGRDSQRAILVNLTDQDQFQRHWQAGRRETKLCLSFSPAWFEQCAAADSLCSARLLQFRRSHWQSLPWQPSADIVQRAYRLVDQHDGHTPLIRRLQYESFALDLATEILLGIDARDRAPRAGGRLACCVERLKDWLDSGTADHLGISQMARELGTNAVDLQNGFRERHGTTIAAYLRRNRLERARMAICQQGVSVDEAAVLAGYEYVSSFSSAFKREYGFSPSRARGR